MKLTGHNHGTIFLGLVNGVVAAPFLAIWSGLQDSKFEVKICVKRQDDGQRRQQNVADEGGDDSGEGLGEAIYGRISVNKGAGEVLIVKTDRNAHQTKGNFQNVSLCGKVHKAIDKAARLAGAVLEEVFIFLNIDEAGHDLDGRHGDKSERG